MEIFLMILLTTYLTIGIIFTIGLYSETIYAEYWCDFNWHQHITTSIKLFIRMVLLTIIWPVYLFANYLIRR